MTKKQAARRTFSVRLPLDVYEKLRAEAKRNVRSLSAQVRYILAQHYGEEPDN